MRILVIEDEKDIADAIRRTLKKYYVVDVVHTAKDGTFQSTVNDYDALIIDYMLPDDSGLTVCNTIRENGIHTPILFLTARYTIRDKVAALNAGADDYMVKPFSSRELQARVRALIRRFVGFYKKDTLSIENLRIDTVNRTVVRDKDDIDLRKKAFDLLEYLLRNKGRVLSRSMILEHVWERGTDDMSNTVDVHIKYLREKIDKPFSSNLIQTVHGIGYVLSDEPYKK